jgi:hypothetical protein
VRVRLAWSLFGLTVLLAVAHVALLVASDRPVLSAEVVGEGFPLVTAGALAGALVGAVIVSRYPGHLIGWLFVVGQLVSELGVALGAYGYSAVAGELGSAPGGRLAVWLSIQAGGLFVVAMLSVLFLLAPDGRLAGPRWRVALAFPILAIAVGTAAVATVRPSELDRHGRLTSDPDLALELALVAAMLAVAVGVVAGVVSMVRRLRRSTGDERQQLRWITLSAELVAAGVAANVLGVVFGAPAWLQPVPLMLAYICVPLFTGVAILRYRLYDIDLFLNRAILLAALTGFVTVGYVAVVVVSGTLVPLTRGAFWPSLLATAVVALAFQPVRKRAERLADRVVYGARAVTYEELAEFSRRLQESPGPEVLLEQVAEEVTRAVGARGVAIRFDVPGIPATQAVWPAAGLPQTGIVRVLPVVGGAERLGELEVVMPGGTELRPDEERLLADLVVQLGRAFDNLRLESVLLGRLEQLHAGASALEESALRLARAQDVERRRFESNLARSVVPHLERVRQGLRDILPALPPPPVVTEAVVTEAAGAGPPERLDPLVAARVAEVLDELTQHTQAALESLRDLTRGVFPMQLERQGIAQALAGYLHRAGRGALEVDASAEVRFEPGVESAAYFCAVEILRDLDGPARVRLAATGDVLELEVVGRGPLPPAHGTEHLQDRAAALDGRLTLSETGSEVRLRLELPLRSPVDAVPDLPQSV